MLLSLLITGAILQQDYTLKTTLKLVPPYDINAMNDEFQDAKLLSEDHGVATFQITYHLFHQQQVTANPNWKSDDAKMVEYLKPRPAANWDADLQAQILSDLKADGIDPDKLDDKDLVEKVSRWALARSNGNTQFGAWMVDFKNGKPEVVPGLRSAFAANEPHGMSDQQLFDREVLGKSMYLNKTHAACTSSSCYLTTILRAIGIPTRIIVTVPAADGNDPAQIKMLNDAIHHNVTRKTILDGVASEGFSNHIFNEVYVGGKWVRLNYDRLGQGIVDKNYEGLITHIYTANDLSEIPFAETWGPRFGMEQGPKLSSVNPYQLLSATDNIPEPAHFDNPAVLEAVKLSSVTVVAILHTGDSRIPDWVKVPEGTDALLSVKEWLPDQDFHQLRDFANGASTEFLLRAPNQPDLKAEFSQAKFSNGGSFQAFGIKLLGKPVIGIEYHLVPLNDGHTHKWLVADGVVVKF
jgi:hypothetical protein